MGTAVGSTPIVGDTLGTAPEWRGEGPDVGDLIDTTEMYLKTVYELEEDGVTPLRARIVERLGHSGPTVSQTVARMERDGLLHVLGDRRLELTREGRDRAVEVMRKHRLAERLLLDVVGLGWTEVHEEACRWEHVMSDEVEARLVEMLHDPSSDPFGNAVPGVVPDPVGVSLEVLSMETLPLDTTVVRIGEPVQAAEGLLSQFQERGILPGAPVRVSAEGSVVSLTGLSGHSSAQNPLVIPESLTPHLFLMPRE